MSIEKLSILVAGAVMTVTFLAILVMPFWSPLVARAWYGPSFEASATTALTELPVSESTCIFDDSTGIFVSSIDELDKVRIIERAARASTILWGTDRPIRRPHFRVYSGGKTYYWSFGEKRFVRFAGERMSLLKTGLAKCASFQKSPTELQDHYKKRYSMDVSRDNFCCIVLSDVA
jgi:hypothetical protein